MIMEFNELKKALAKEAKAAGICKEWHKYILEANSKERLLTLFYAGLDFVISNDYPSKRLRDEFSGTRQAYGIFDDGEVFSRRNPRNILAYSGAVGAVSYDGYTVGQLWARAGSKITVRASANAYVSIDMVEGASVKIETSGKARVSVFLHGGTLEHREQEEATVTIKNE